MHRPPAYPSRLTAARFSSEMSGGKRGVQSASVVHVQANMQVDGLTYQPSTFTGSVVTHQWPYTAYSCHDVPASRGSDGASHTSSPIATRSRPQLPVCSAQCAQAVAAEPRMPAAERTPAMSMTRIVDHPRADP